jgi:hypothetical protein
VWTFGLGDFTSTIYVTEAVSQGKIVCLNVPFQSWTSVDILQKDLLIRGYYHRVSLKAYNFIAIILSETFHFIMIIIRETFNFIVLIIRERESRDSSVDIALGYGLDDRGSRVRFPAGAVNFSLHHHVQNGSGAHPASCPMGKAVGA